MKKIIPVIGILLFGCQSWDRTPGLTLYNRSDKMIYYWLSCDSSYENVQVTDNNRLFPNDSIMPYLLYGPEGKGPDDNPWVNAINNADDSSLHIFCLYVDFKNDLNRSDSLYNLVMKRYDYKADSLKKLHWKITYP